MRSAGEQLEDFFELVDDWGNQLDDLGAPFALSTEFEDDDDWPYGVGWYPEDELEEFDGLGATDAGGGILSALVGGGGAPAGGAGGGDILGGVGGIVGGIANIIATSKAAKAAKEQNKLAEKALKQDKELALQQIAATSSKTDALKKYALPAAAGLALLLLLRR